MKKLRALFFFYGIVTVAVQVFFQHQLLAGGWGPGDIGQLLAIATAINFLSSLPTGVLADTFGHKKVTLVGLGLLILSGVVGFTWFSPGGIALAFCLYNLADATVAGAVQMWTKDVQAIQTSVSVSKNSPFTGFLKRIDQQQRYGMICGGILIGGVLTATRFVSGNWVFVLVFGVLALLTGLITPAGKVIPRSAPLLSRFNFSLLSRGISGELSVFFKFAALALFFFGLSEGILGAVFWSRVRDLDIHSPIYLGIIGSLGSVCRILGMEFVLRKGKEVAQDRVVYVSLIGVSLLVVLFALVTSPVLAMGLWMVRIFVFAPYFPTHQAVVMERSPAGLGATFLSTAGSLALGGTFLGGMSVKVLGSSESGYMPFFVAGILGFAAASCWQIAFERSRRFQ